LCFSYEIIYGFVFFFFFLNNYFYFFFFFLQKKKKKKKDDDMNSTKTLLGNTMNKLGVMMQTQGGSVMWILIIFVLCVLIFVYFYIKK